MDVNTSAIKEAHELDKKYNFFITINEKYKGDNLIAIKDNISTKGIRTTAGSRILENYVPVYDATVIKRLKKKGFDIIGKTSMDEFGFGSFSVNTFKIPKNPHDPSRSCGGSSGGAAGYIAASKYCNVALATSTGGSISCPASFCGVVGLTPTYGLVSRYGLIDYACSLDKIGIIAKKVEDATEILDIIKGPDKKDSTSVDINHKEKIKEINKINNVSVKKLKIAIPKEYFYNLEKEVETSVWDTIKKLENENFKYEKVSLPLTEYALYAYYIIALAEASTNLAKFCGLRYGSTIDLKGNFNEYFSNVRGRFFGKEAKRRILLGTFVRLAGYRERYYLKALKVRQKIINEFKQIFKKFDVILAPTMPIIAPKFSEIEKLSPLQQYQLDVLTVPSNLAGLPSISLPIKKRKMPVGLHLIGNHFNEKKILALAKFIENLKKGK